MTAKQLNIWGRGGLDLKLYLTPHTQSNLKCCTVKRSHAKPEIASFRKSTYKLALAVIQEFEFQGHSLIP